MNKQLMLKYLPLVSSKAKLLWMALVISFAAVTGVCAPVVDFVTPPLGTNGPIIGQVSGLDSPSQYMVLLLTSQNKDIQGFLWLTQAKSVEKLKKEEPLEWQ